jgi:hypothetical protein
VATTDAHKGQWPASRSFVSLSPSHLVLNAIKKAEDSDAWIVQWYDSKGEDSTAELTLPWTPRKDVMSNFLEEDGQQVTVASEARGGRFGGRNLKATWTEQWRKASGSAEEKQRAWHARAQKWGVEQVEG